MLLIMKKVQENIANNLRKLMTHHQLTQAALAKKTEVSQKTISNMLNLNSEGNVTVISLERIAQYFGIQAYQLMIPDLPIEKSTIQDIERIIDCYTHSSHTSQENIKRVAELEARYSKFS